MLSLKLFSQQEKQLLKYIWVKNSIGEHMHMFSVGRGSWKMKESSASSLVVYLKSPMKRLAECCLIIATFSDKPSDWSAPTAQSDTSYTHLIQKLKQKHGGKA